MRANVFGLGYVGCVTAACLARDGHDVLGVDTQPHKVDLVAAGRSPIVEPGLGQLIAAAVSDRKLSATTDGQMAVLDGDLSLICVGTPSNGNGSLTLRYVENVCREIGSALADRDDYHVVVVRSTVLPRTVRNNLISILEKSSGRRAGRDFGVCMNPEFLREGSAIKDYDHPSQIVIGEFDERSGDVLEKMYSGIDAPVVRTSIETAEMVKYVCNAFHGVKVVFANEIGNHCKAHGIDGRDVMDIFCRDTQLNISPAYLQPGFAFGGSCLPKDLRALVYEARRLDLEAPLLEATLTSNLRQIERGIRLVEETGRKKVGVFGLSFKANTDDVRESPIVPLVESLVGRGYDVSVYDENVVPQELIGTNKTYLEQQLPHIMSLMRSTVDEVISNSDVLVVTNNSAAFRRVPELIRQNQIMIDLAGSYRVNGECRGKYEGICW